MFVGICDPIVTWGYGSFRAEVPRPILRICVAVAAPAAPMRAPSRPAIGARVGAAALPILAARGARMDVALGAVAMPPVRARPPGAGGFGVCARGGARMAPAAIAPPPILRVAIGAGATAAAPIAVAATAAVAPARFVLAAAIIHAGCPCRTT